MPAFEKEVQRGWFTKGGQGQAATYPGADWFNMIQAEALNLLYAAGVLPDKKKVNQWAEAVAIIASQIADEATSEKFLLISRNLADINDKAQARQNLNVPSNNELTTALSQLAQQFSQQLQLHVNAQDPHPQYLLSEEGSQLAQQAISAHKQEANPHTQYVSQNKVNEDIAAHANKTGAHAASHISFSAPEFDAKNVHDALIELRQSTISEDYQLLFEDAVGQQTGNIVLSKSFRDFDEIVVIGGTDNRAFISPYVFTPNAYDIVRRFNPTRFDLWHRDSASWGGYFESDTVFKTTSENARIFAIYGVNFKRD
ncbi:hypothetical protein [Shewanella xiamenensis]|uniref:hypothetical protein n=1 Tax=Shewanella xiamenensis TaxID=332186 RepID=UPI001112ED50|nr:hypothetical protein [Shewanella xiamenensis]